MTRLLVPLLLFLLTVLPLLAPFLLFLLPVLQLLAPLLLCLLLLLYKSGDARLRLYLLGMGRLSTLVVVRDGPLDIGFRYRADHPWLRVLPGPALRKFVSLLLSSSPLLLLCSSPSLLLSSPPLLPCVFLPH